MHRRTDSSFWEWVVIALMVVGLCILVGALIFGTSCFMGWLTMICLGMFGVKAPFWGCVLAYFILSCLFAAARQSQEASK